MEDLAHQPEAGAEDTAGDLSTGNAVIEAENTDAQDFYADDKPQGQEPQTGEPEGDEADADGEPQEDIAAPVGLKAEDQAKFAQLAPEAQRVVADILHSRNLDAQKGVQAALNAQREAERSAADQAAKTQQDFAQRFSQLVNAFAPQPPPIELARENPAEYQYRKAVFDEEYAQYGQLVQQIGGMQQSSAQHFQTRSREWFQEQVDELSRDIPDYADEAKRPAFLANVKSVGLELGYSEEDLAQASAKDLKGLSKVAKWKAGFERDQAHRAKRNERPRAAQGRFAAAPAGNGAAAQTAAPVDLAKSMYPND